MRHRTCFLLATTCCLIGGAVAKAEPVTAGTELLDGSGAPDGWTNILYIDENSPFDFAGTGQTEGVLTNTNFWVASGRDRGSLYTPFIAEPVNDPGVTGEDFIIRAIGTTREAQTDYACQGLYQFPFHDTETFAVQNGWFAGFMSSDPDSERTDAASPIPFVANAGVEGWLTGTAAAGEASPAISMGDTIFEGASGTDIDAYGFRGYQFNVQAEPGTTKPDLGPGGKVGDACPPPPTPETGKIGAPLPLEDQAGVDGWSGIPVMFGNQLPAGESVSVVRYYPDDDRELALEDELYAMVPLIVMQEGGSLEDGEGDFSIWEVGPAHVPTEAGEQEFAWSSSEIPDDGNLYHPAALQWQLDTNDTDGGLISFGEGGEGMHFFNVDTTDYVPGEDIGEVEAELFLTGLETHSSPFGGRAYQLNFEMSSAGGEPGDFNGDGALDAADINDLSAQIRVGGAGSSYDLNDDGSVDDSDRDVWVKDLRNTWFGDSNLDGEFNSSDFVAVFQGGLFETDADATWELGDWDGDGRFNSSDFVIAFQDGGFELGPRAATASVPEPHGILLLLLGLLGLAKLRR